MSANLKLAGISGSLRAGSFNTKLLVAAQTLLPEGVDLEVITLERLPLFSADLEAEGLPDAVAQLRDRLAPAEGIIIATPEYNYSVPGVLKNAIDWLSRTPSKSAIRGKPVAIIGASTAMAGTARAQAHLRDVVFYNAMPLLASHELILGRVQEKFDVDGRLVDEKSVGKLGDLLGAFADFVRANPVPLD